ncbi:hypothetical protein P7C66_02s2g02200 [Encephalitozoon intestinalis]
MEVMKMDHLVVVILDLQIMKNNMMEEMIQVKAHRMVRLMAPFKTEINLLIAGLVAKILLQNSLARLMAPMVV